MAMEPVTVLFLCTGNSARSIMAEAILNSMGRPRFVALSAGSHPTGVVNPKSLETLKRHNIECGELRSQSWDECSSTKVDLVVTVCDQAAGESCPLFHGSPEKRHWSIPDPARVSGTDEEIATAFDEAFRLLHTRIEQEILS